MSTSFPTSSTPAAPRVAGPSPRPRSRPTAVLGLLAGAGAALLGMVLCAVVGLIGWYLSDAGSHGEPNAGLLAGVRGWLVGHGAGLTVDGVAVTLIPLGLTVLLGWMVWQVSLRLGETVWDHGPDEARAGDGERDFTVFLATAGFTVGYLVVALVAAANTAGEGWEPVTGAVVRWSLLFTVVFGGVGITIGSGRSEGWRRRVPVSVQDALRGAGALLMTWLGASAVLFTVAMVWGLGDAVDTVARLGTSPGESVLLVLVCLLVLPQAVLYASAFLMGPGFAFGAGTAVAPAGVILGPLPLVPILGALPDEGAAPAWWAIHLGVPLVLAVVVVARRHLFLRVTDWMSTAVAGAGAGFGAAVLLGLLTSVADGAIGPGRMAEIGASGGNVFTAALIPFVGGGLLGALVATWWVRRGGVPVEPAAPGPEAAPATDPEADLSTSPDDPSVGVAGAEGESPDGDTEFTIPVVLPEPEPEPDDAEAGGVEAAGVEAYRAPSSEAVEDAAQPSDEDDAPRADSEPEARP